MPAPVLAIASSLLAVVVTTAPAAEVDTATTRSAPVRSGISATTHQPLFEGLGTHSRRVGTRDPAAQDYVDQGLAFLYGFNHAEARRSFAQATQLDPDCAMAWWGVAMSYGPHINFPLVPDEQTEAARAAADRAAELAPQAGPADQALIAAIDRRYAHPQPEDRAPLDQAYADAMRTAWRDHPEDADVGALFAEALLDLRPWDQWTPAGEPQPGTAEILDTLAAVLALDPRHPLGCHLMIHALEASPEPARAQAAADALRDLMPGIGHMVHMPSHIDVRTGAWAEAIRANEKAILADRSYRAQTRAGDLGLINLYMAHDQHMLVFAAMMCGQSLRALQVARDMVDDLPVDWLRAHAAFADGYAIMPTEVLLRFGRWQEVLDEPLPPEHLPLSQVLAHAARATAAASLGDLERAHQEQEACRRAQDAVPEEATFGNNRASDVAAVAAAMSAGEILIAADRLDDGIARLRSAIALEDALRYDEPPSWIIPVRHALGAVLLNAGRAAEAERVYREDLARWPRNGWSLYGLARSLRAQGRPQEAETIDAIYQEVWRDSDIALASSCFCQPMEEVAAR